MSLEASLLSWVEVLESGYGTKAEPKPATPAEIGRLEESWGATFAASSANCCCTQTDCSTATGNR